MVRQGRYKSGKTGEVQECQDRGGTRVSGQGRYKSGKTGEVQEW